MLGEIKAADVLLHPLLIAGAVERALYAALKEKGEGQDRLVKAVEI